MHPAEDIRGIKSNILSKKRIVIGVTGSIAAVETVKLSRELIRHGADIFPVMSQSATKIIHPDSLWFASGNKPIVELSGATEHVSFCGKTKDPVDMLLISPCTANTISKIAHGIDDTVVTTFATTAIGSGIPIMIVPAMHISMYDHKIVQENIKICKKIGIKFIGPKIEKNKAKFAEIDEIVANVIRIIGKKDLKKNKILIIGGPTEEPVDDVRFIGNRSSGKTAVHLVKNAFLRGADVEFWYGAGKEKPPNFIKTISFWSINDVIKQLKSIEIKKFDTIIVCAALSDYLPKKVKGKISSKNEKIEIKMDKAPKVISLIRPLAPKAKIIGFKVEENIDKIKQGSKELLNKNKLDLIVGNTVQGFEKDKNEIWILDKSGNYSHKKGDKSEIADFILDKIK